MAKINATYSSGYYLGPDVDYRKLEEQQQAEQRRKRHRGGDLALSDNTKRQTFAIPFNIFCEHCNRRIVRGSHVYANRRMTNKRYLKKIIIWELEIRCQYCSEFFYFHTDPETPKVTGGYVCVRGCKRVEDDYYTLNQENEKVRAQWAKDKAEAAENPLAAMERDNEATRQIALCNRQIEEDVIANANCDNEALLASLQVRRCPALDHADDPSFPTLPGMGHTAEEETKAEAEYQRFEAEMRRCWEDNLTREAAGREEGLGGGSYPMPPPRALVRSGPATAHDARELTAVLQRYSVSAVFTPGGNLCGDAIIGKGSSSRSSATPQAAEVDATALPFKASTVIPPALRNNAFALNDDDDDDGVKGCVVRPLTAAEQQQASSGGNAVPKPTASRLGRVAAATKASAPPRSFLHQLLADDGDSSADDDCQS